MEYPTCEHCGAAARRGASACHRCGRKQIVENRPDPTDGLPVGLVGDWTVEKHERLRKYVDISRGARRKFDRGGSTYIDPFCNYGRARIKESGELIDGSPLVAAKMAQDGGAPFREVHIGDLDPDCVHTATARLRRIRIEPNEYVGPAAETVKQITSSINPYGLHFAFVDPYNLESLPFDVIKTLAAVNHMDILIHVSLVDLQRNLPAYIAAAGQTPLDVFAPGWRSAIDPTQRQNVVRQQVLDHYLGLIRRLDMQPAQGIEVVKGSRNQNLYWLIFAARHERALEFWEKIRTISGQRTLGF